MKKKNLTILLVALLITLGCLYLPVHNYYISHYVDSEIVKKETLMNSTTCEIEVLTKESYTAEKAQHFADAYPIKENSVNVLKLKFYSQYDDSKKIQTSDYLLYEIVKPIT